MTDRRSLIEGLKQTPSTIDPKLEKEFVFKSKPATSGEGTSPASPSVSPVAPIARSPISTRIRADFAAALKRTSLERQLKGIEPNTLQDILEEAIEPWLKANGAIP